MRGIYKSAPFLLVMALVFAAQCAAGLLRGRTWTDNWLEWFAWAAAAAAVFAGARYRNKRKGVSCALCETFEPRP